MTTPLPYPVVANIDFAEGPIFDESGSLYFVNYLRNGNIGCMEPNGTVRVWHQGDDVMLGLKCDGAGGLVATDHTRKRIVRFDLETRELTVLTAECEGNPYNGPNDLCFDRDGTLYFTDPGENVTEAVGAIYSIERSGAVRRLDKDLSYPNGIAVSRDDNRLYVSETGTRRILTYDLVGGLATNRRVLHEFADDGVDGIMFDSSGRLWVARWRKGTVDCLDRNGKLVASLPAGGDVTNLCWWRTSLFVTVADRHSIHRLDVGFTGARQCPDATPRHSEADKTNHPVAEPNDRE